MLTDIRAGADLEWSSSLQKKKKKKRTIEPLTYPIYNPFSIDT